MFKKGLKNDFWSKFFLGKINSKMGVGDIVECFWVKYVKRYI